MKKSHLLLLATLICLAYAAVDYPHVNQRCQQDDDCGRNFEFCNDSGRCKHKPMFPMRPMEIAGWIAYTLIVTFSNFSGMAGGLPLIVIIGMFNFNMKSSIPLSNAQIWSAAIVRLALDGRNPHPLRKKGTIVDYPIVSMMFPMITVGSAISSFSSPAIPDIYITIGFAVIVFGVMIFSIFRLTALIKKESALSKPKVEPPTPIQTNIAETDSDITPQSDSDSPRNGDCSKIEFEEKADKGEKLAFPDDNEEITYKQLCWTRKYTKKELREKIEDDESSIVQPKYLLQLLVASIGFVILMLLRGSGEKSSIAKVDRCEGLYWGLGAILIGYGIFMSAVAGFVQKQTYDLKKSVNWQFLPGDYKFTLGSAIFFPFAGLIFSFSAILFGFSPAFWYITVLLYFDLQPQVVMYTNAVLSMFSTLCSVTLSLLFNQMPYDYFLASLVASMIGAIPGILLQSYVIGLTKRSQYSLAGFNLIVVSCLVSVTAYQAIMIDMKSDDGISAFKRNSYCVK